MLEKNKFLIKGETKIFSSKKNYEILDGDGGEVLGTATTQIGLLASVMGMVLGKDKTSLAIQVRQKSDDKVVFSVRRSGLLFKKIQAVDAEGQVVGTYKAKMLSLSGGFHVYDKEGKHFAEIKGKMLKSEYKFVTPDGSTEMGSVSRTWGGLAKSLLGSAGSYGVEIAPAYAGNTTAKMLILGAAIAVDALFVKGGVKGAAGGGGDGGGDE